MIKCFIEHPKTQTWALKTFINKKQFDLFMRCRTGYKVQAFYSSDTIAA